MVDKPKSGLASLLLAHVVCCGGLLLLATGGLSGIGHWLSEDGATWIVGIGVVLAAAAVIWRRRKVKNCETKLIEPVQHSAE